MPDLVPPLAPAPDWLAGSSSTSREGPRTEPSNKESPLDGAALRPSRRVPLCATTGRHDGRRGLTGGRDERMDRYRTAPDRNRPMKTRYTRPLRAIWHLVPALLALTGCAQTVWVNAGATDADSEVAMERCLSAAYLQAPSAPSDRHYRQRCRVAILHDLLRLGSSGACVTSRGQLHTPAHHPIRRQRQDPHPALQAMHECSGLVRASHGATAATMDAPEDDWTRGFDVGHALGGQRSVSLRQVALPMATRGRSVVGVASRLGECDGGREAG